MRACVCACVCMCTCVSIYVYSYQLSLPSSPQALWALGNIAANGAGAREDVLRHGVVPALLKWVPSLSLHTLCMLCSIHIKL